MTEPCPACDPNVAKNEHERHETAKCQALKNIEEGQKEINRRRIEIKVLREEITRWQQYVANWKGQYQALVKPKVVKP